MNWLNALLRALGLARDAARADENDRAARARADAAAGRSREVEIDARRTADDLRRHDHEDNR